MKTIFKTCLVIWRLSFNADLEQVNRTLSIKFSNLLSDFETLRTTVLKRVPECGTGYWWQLVHLNMSDPLQQCPSPWREYTSIRSCGRRESSRSSCESVTFDVGPQNYTKVCGRAIGYQYASPDAFCRMIYQRTRTADDNYVDGLSVTHGRSPRKHIWTFAAGMNEYQPNVQTNRLACPCTYPDNSRFGTSPPSYVGNNYFCETGNADNWFDLYHYPEPLWDGQGCVTSQCCTFSSPPWFSVQLPSPTDDNIEVRICGDQRTYDEDVTIELLQVYIQ